MRTILIKIPILMVILYIAGCANQSPAINSKDKWIFAHMATHAQISNNTTLVIPLTQDIIAFTQYPYQKQAAFTGSEFTSFLENENKTGTRHAVLSWLNGEKIEQVTLIVKDIVISEEQKSIVYSTEAVRSLRGVRELVSPHLYMDRYQTKRNEKSHEYRYPHTDHYPRQQAEYATRNRMPTGKKQ